MGESGVGAGEEGGYTGCHAAGVAGREEGQVLCCSSGSWGVWEAGKGSQSRAVGTRAAVRAWGP